MAAPIEPHVCTYQNCENYIEHSTTMKKEKKSGPIVESLVRFAQAFATAYAQAKSLTTRNVDIQE